jgi:hypothetical protein
MHNKWLYFCREFERSSSDPSQADMNAYIAWLGTAASWAAQRGGDGEPMKFRSVKKYVEHVGRALRELHKTDRVVTDSMQTHWALQASKRLLGDTMQRARPITLLELKAACANVQGPEGFVLAFRVIALTAWFAAMRLGQLLPASLSQKVATMLLSDLEISNDGQAVLVSSSRSKTNVFRAKLRKVAISMCSSDLGLCLRKALLDLLQFRRVHGLRTDIPLCSLHEDLATFDQFVNVMQRLIPAKESSPFEKGHVTGHSFRRGFTKAALLAGFSIEAIMLHGDWSHPDSVVNSYAAGAVLPSIPMARHVGPLLSGASAFVVPSTFASRGQAEVARPLASAAPVVQTVGGPVFSRGNPFVPVGIAADVNRELLARQARQWEFDNGHWSTANPFKPSAAAPANADMDWLMWLNKRARHWELENNQELEDRDVKRSKG